MQNTIHKYHFIGIGGVGMSALAHILLEKRALVSGSDKESNAYCQALKERGAHVVQGHSAKHVSRLDTVIYTSQVTPTNPEFQAALALQCPLLHRSDLLARLMEGHQVVTVTGTHGKTTTSALLAHVLTSAGCDPTYALGGKMEGVNGRAGAGAFFVAEADESDGTFLKYCPEASIVTNMELEHMEYYKTASALAEAFSAFMHQIRTPSKLLYCADDKHLASLAPAGALSYGFSPHAGVQITHFWQEGWTIRFSLAIEGVCYPDLTLPLVGKHNALNGAAVFGLALRLGLDPAVIAQGLASFPGVERRCQRVAEASGVLFIDDYAHHPTEVHKTLEALRFAVEERRLVVCFQPHRYSRTAALFDAFSGAFSAADQVIVTDIYAAHEAPVAGVSAQALAKAVAQKSRLPCQYVPQTELTAHLQMQLRPHDVFVTLGAGNIYSLYSTLLPQFQARKWHMGIVFGGASYEHEISLRSCRFVVENLNSAFYQLSYFALDKQGHWVWGAAAQEALQHPSVPMQQGGASFLDPPVAQALKECDLFFPVVHGPNVEDGTLQGLFEMLQKPYAGPNHRAAAIAMDKVLTKRLVGACGVPTPKDHHFSAITWQVEKESLLALLANDLRFPVYVKPVHLGSSVGIQKVEILADLEGAIDHAFQYDDHVMVEEGKEGCRELEFAVLGNSDGFRVRVPPPGEKLAAGGFVTYALKYGAAPVATTVAPELPPSLLKQGQEYAAAAYRACSCSGMTRVDFLLDDAGTFWFFEMNPIPGMQQFSLFPKIWLREGYSMGALLDTLVILGLHRYRTQRRTLAVLG